jgi:hypothetical protein
VRLLVLPREGKIISSEYFGCQSGSLQPCLVRTDRFSFDAPVNGPTLGLCSVVLCCSAVPWGRSMLPLSASSRPPLSPHLWGASHKIRKSRSSPFHSLPQLFAALFAALPSAFLARADAPQRLQHARPNTKFSPLCARRPPLSESPCPGLGPIIRHGVHANQSGAVAGGDVIMEPSIHPSPLIKMVRDSCIVWKGEARARCGQALSNL